MNRFLIWLDRYIYLDRLKQRPVQVLPRMTARQWGWYVPAVVVTGAGFYRLYDLADKRLNGVFGALLLWFAVFPIIGLLSGTLYRFILPARKAREAAPGEAWLIGALWMAGAGLDWLVTKSLR